MVSEYVPPTGTPREILLLALEELHSKFGNSVPEVHARKAIKRALEDAGIKATSEAVEGLWVAINVHKEEYTERAISRIV